MKRLLLATCLILGAAINAAAAPVVVNFDDLPGDALVPNGYGGIDWQDHWSYYGSPQPPYNASSLYNRIYNNYGLFNVGDHTEVSFLLPAGSTFQGAYVAGSFDGGPTLSFNLYYNNVLVASTSDLVPSDIPTFLASGYNGLVDRVGVYGYVGFYVLDDVTYTPGDSRVPEPGTYALAGLGLAALALFRRRN